MRIDQYAAGILSSRSKAQEAIKQKRVLVNGKAVTKPSIKITESDTVEILPAHEFVSRAGGKLLGAIEEFDICLQNEVVLDIGASTGGFTQCVLEHGARKVYALDVGHLQLSPLLQSDPRVVMMEGRNAKELGKDWFDEDIDFICMDVSFISSAAVLEPVLSRIRPQHLVLLFKPQFECGPKALNKHGVLKNPALEKELAEKARAFLKQYYPRVYLMPSPVKGKEGNQEYLLYAFETPEQKSLDLIPLNDNNNDSNSQIEVKNKTEREDS